MKKSILLITILIIVSTLCSCGTKSENKITNSEPDVKTSSSVQNDKTVLQNEQSSHYEYTHSALEGCVITKSDRLTGECVYKTKCPVCGETSSGTTSTYLKSGILNSGATCTNTQCSNWGKHFDVKIETTSQLIDD